MVLTAIFAFIFFGCEKDEVDYADESITLSTTTPCFSIYKTKQNYFNNIAVKMDESHKLIGYPGYDATDGRIDIDNNGKVTYNRRWKLKSGYIAATEMGPNLVFPNVTFQEFVDYQSEDNEYIPREYIASKVTDFEPFAEYYIPKECGYPGVEITLGELNDMIENGTLETFFNKEI